ncbi:MAG TPA: putative sulfate exporter family transporter [Bacteroidia bacterium]|nr:putative sulfate exporter family transporter [Bacteroidia bacterium]
MNNSSEESSEKFYFVKDKNTRKVIFIITLILCASPLVSPPIALLLGILIAQFIGHPYLHLNHKATHLLLQTSVVGLGFGMNVNTALEAGKEGFVFTVLTIIVTLVLGYLVGKLLKVNHKTSYLISSGTAICGGSAIAAISPIIKANEEEVSVSLGTIFILNSIALFVFPFIGEALNLSESKFGLWSAIAIHDTSSVVGAASKFGDTALKIATTVKLSRALWIIPLALFSSFIFKSKHQKIKIPYFIGYYVLAIILNTYIPLFKTISPTIISISKTGLTITLFLIGSGLSKKAIYSVGIRPVLQGVLVWIILSVSTLLVIINY